MELGERKRGEEAGSSAEATSSLAAVDKAPTGAISVYEVSFVLSVMVNGADEGAIGMDEGASGVEWTAAISGGITSVCNRRSAPKESNKRQRTGNGHHAPSLSFAGCSTQPENVLVEQMHVYRMSYTYTSSLPISPPEIRHSRHNQFLTVATRAGVILYAEDTLECVDKGYAETVDNTPLVQSRLAFNDRVILALPHPKSGHMAGGLYFFRRGAVGDIRLKAGPGVAGGIVYMDVHPRMQVIIGTPCFMHINTA